MTCIFIIVSHEDPRSEGQLQLWQIQPIFARIFFLRSLEVLNAQTRYFRNGRCCDRKLA